MYSSGRLSEIDYLVVGHITRDETPQGAVLGGSVTYASLTARTLGYRVGVVTSWAEDLDFPEVDNIQIVNFRAEKTTCFTNVYIDGIRKQVINAIADSLDYYMIPEIWRNTPMVHLAPVANEVEPNMLRYFKNSFVGISLQGWLRGWGPDGKVSSEEWPESAIYLPMADAVVLSDEDVNGDWDRIYAMSASVPVLVVTRNKFGAVLFFQGREEHIPAKETNAVDPTGAGDVFATVFFHWLRNYNDPEAAARFANQIAAFSVKRAGLSGIPDKDELYDLMQEVV